MPPKKTAIQNILAREIMQVDLVTISRGASLADLESKLSDHRVSGLPVTDGSGHIVGVVSMRDLIDRYAGNPDARPSSAPSFYHGLDEEDWLDPGSSHEGAEGVVADIMTAELHTVGVGDALAAVARKMCDLGLHRVLAKDDNRVVGLISTTDILRAVADAAD